VEHKIESFINTQVYIHLETTNGTDASHNNEQAYNVGEYIRNEKVSYTQAKIIGEVNVTREGMKMETGWIYPEGLTDWIMHEGEKLLLAGHDREGRLMVSLQISETPFDY